MSFVPIKLGDYVRLFLKSNPGENEKHEARGFEKRLRRTRPESGAIAASRSGSSARRKPGTPASRASQGKRIRRKTTRSPRHATRPVSPLGAVVGTAAHTSSMCPRRGTPPGRRCQPVRGARAIRRSRLQPRHHRRRLAVLKSPTPSSMGKRPQRHTCPQAKKLCRLQNTATLSFARQPLAYARGSVPYPFGGGPRGRPVRERMRNYLWRSV